MFLFYFLKKNASFLPGASFSKKQKITVGKRERGEYQKRAKMISLRQKLNADTPLRCSEFHDTVIDTFQKLRSLKCEHLYHILHILSNPLTRS